MENFAQAGQQLHKDANTLYDHQCDLSSKQKYQDLLHTLEGIGVLRYQPDERVNIPDLYRVAAGIKRRGGVKSAR
jgi:hypothetical protein